jgi:uncharacterized protein with FMN-binding domain
MKIKHVLLSILLVLILAVAGVYAYLQKSLDQLVEMPISNIDLTKVEDGIYTGSYAKFPVDAKVKVTVKDHRITAIDLIEHGNGKGAPAEVIPGKVVEAQSLDVDAISGATYSSKVILKAIENALTSAY